MDKGAWWATVHGFAELDTTEELTYSRNPGFPKQEYWSVLPFPFPGNFPDLRMEPVSLQADFLLSELPWKPKMKPSFSISCA